MAFGAPPKFSAWRPYQEQAVSRAADGQGARFLVQVQPTGSGKSLCYVMAAVLSGKRVLILTSTKALQDQITGDFGEAFRLADVRGQGSYPCLYDTAVSCEDGVCHVGYQCELKEMGCLYYDAVRAAKRSQIVVSNYAFWITSARFADSIGRFDWLVLDEAHDAPEWVMKSVSAAIPDQICADLNCQLPITTDPVVWKSWAGNISQKVEKELEVIGKVIGGGQVGLASKAMRLKRYQRALGNVLINDTNNMVVDRESVNGYTLIEPISAVGLAEKLLFRGVGRVLLTSATVRPKTMAMMGISERGDLQVEEYPSQFDPSRRPVIFVPTTRVQHDMSVDSEKKWVAQIDNVIRQRLDRKGIIHSVSYSRAKRIRELSEFKNRMIVHGRYDLNKVLMSFREAEPPAILVSPSVSTGYDFPYDQTQYQIIAKVAFPDTRTVSIKARVKHDPEYSYYITMQQVVQASGRGMRSADDQCEVLILDDNWVWFVKKWGKFAPKWFLDSCSVSRTIPRPPAPLIRR